MFKSNYSHANKILHRFAFASQRAQIVLADMEDDLYKSRLEGVAIDEPVFITGLPRAGTTTLLDLYARSGAFAAHSYRQMPFVHTPLLWNAFARRMAGNEAPQERSHGDGILIDVDSNEALEEMLWLAFWKKRYRYRMIEVWPEQAKPEFDAYLRQHLRKIIALSSPCMRYVSKNNLNISRLPYLRRLFPDAHLVVPFRQPLQQATSLLNQHLNFLERHREDKFARDYMAALGHFDFGENLKPVNFDGWFEHTTYAPGTINFWLSYWSHAYGYIMKNAPATGALLLAYDRLCADPAPALERLSRATSINPENDLHKLATDIRQPKDKQEQRENCDRHLLEECESLYRQLLTTAPL